MSIEAPFWQHKLLSEMNKEEWESLCDGCGYCCLMKLQDDESDRIYTTNVACRLLDLENCRCMDYPNRQKEVEACLVLTVDKPELFCLLPETCAYRTLYEKRTLPDWHPLLTGQRVSTSQAGVSVCDYAVSEESIHPEQLEDHIIHELQSGDES
ncbi:MAG: YcgN family cysteine cluster protein [Gammaproteobacteria bacterium]|nr:YcgN family cysteine cluster protein [Gammaproteobacteria bacterium]